MDVIQEGSGACSTPLEGYYLLKRACDIRARLTNGIYRTDCRNPQALSSALATLGTLQPGAFRFLHLVVPWVSVSIAVI